MEVSVFSLTSATRSLQLISGIPLEQERYMFILKKLFEEINKKRIESDNLYKVLVSATAHSMFCCIAETIN